MRKNSWKMCLPALTLLGCGAEPGNAEPASDTASEVLTDTIVTIKADGSLEQIVKTVSAEQRRLELQAIGKRVDSSAPHAAAAGQLAGISSSKSAVLRTDASCNSWDLWLWDAEQKNRLCIAYTYLGTNESDSLDLSRVRFGSACYTIPCTSFPSWSGRVSWIWSGYNNGGLYSETPWVVTPFSAWEPRARAIDPVSSKIVYFEGTRLN